MTDQEKRSFERFLIESFENDVLIRELRLSEEELQYLVELMPKANIIEMPDSIFPDRKKWYKVSLR